VRWAKSASGGDVDDAALAARRVVLSRFDRLAKKRQQDRQRPGRKREIVNPCTTMVKTTTA
jgi:hypothetical protein